MEKATLQTANAAEALRSAIIAALGCELYGLTDEEIRLVAGGKKIVGLGR